MTDCSERIQFERYRLSVISTWPDSDLKSAALASARAALQREQAVEQFHLVSTDGGVITGQIEN